MKLDNHIDLETLKEWRTKLETLRREADIAEDVLYAEDRDNPNRLTLLQLMPACHDAWYALIRVAVHLEKLQAAKQKGNEQ